jgi:hypothetical protein
VTIETVREAGATLGIAPACVALGLPTATYYRRIGPKPPPEPRPSPPRKLAVEERAAVLEVLHAPGSVDLAPGQVYAQLLDAERYLCSERTMYRILEENHEVRERRDQLRHPPYAAPELLATAPNQVWSWDITKLLGPAKWTYFYAYVIMDSCEALACRGLHNRKNHYGSRSERGTRVAALFYSLIESAKLVGLEPGAYLAEATRRAIVTPGTVTLPAALRTP